MQTQVFTQIPQDKRSSRLSTFNSPYGRYCFLCVPFGIISAAEIYHKIATQLYEGIYGVRLFVSDILIYENLK